MDEPQSHQTISRALYMHKSPYSTASRQTSSQASVLSSSASELLSPSSSSDPPTRRVGARAPGMAVAVNAKLPQVAGRASKPLAMLSTTDSSTSLRRGLSAKPPVPSSSQQQMLPHHHQHSGSVGQNPSPQASMLVNAQQQQQLPQQHHHHPYQPPYHHQAQPQQAQQPPQQQQQQQQQQPQTAGGPRQSSPNDPFQASSESLRTKIMSTLRTSKKPLEILRHKATRASQSTFEEQRRMSTFRPRGSVSEAPSRTSTGFFRGNKRIASDETLGYREHFVDRRTSADFEPFQSSTDSSTTLDSNRRLQMDDRRGSPSHASSSEGVRFRAFTGAPAKPPMHMSRFNRTPSTQSVRRHNPSHDSVRTIDSVGTMFRVTNPYA